MKLPGPIVSATWLQQHLHDVRIADIRWSIPTGPKRAEHTEQHIPGAVFVDLDADASAAAGRAGRHPLPTPEAFAAARARLGLVGPVVIYDDKGGSVAARLWWMLDALGVDAAVLDGGLQAWSGALEAGEVPATPAEVAAVPWPQGRTVDADGLAYAIGAGAHALDARSASRFRGEPNPIDLRFGHVPGARSWPWESNLNEDGRFLPAAVLRERFERQGLTGAGELIASCGSGVTGCHILLAARWAGLGDGRLYPGSWSEWTQDDARPIETGDA